MKTTLANRLRDSLVERLNTLYFWCELEQCPFDRYLERRKEFTSSHDYTRVPSHVRSYLRGYSDCLYQARARKFVYVHAWKDRAYLSWTDLPEEAIAYYRENPGKLVSTRVWPTIKTGIGPKDYRPVVNGDLISDLKPWGKWESEDEGKARYESECNAEYSAMGEILGENLDAFACPKDLRKHARKVGYQAPRAYRDYCEAKARAMTLRAKGEINKALKYEQDCESLYDAIHSAWKW